MQLFAFKVFTNIATRISVTEAKKIKTEDQNNMGQETETSTENVL